MNRGQFPGERTFCGKSVSHYFGAGAGARKRSYTSTMKICSEYLLAAGLAMSAVTALAACSPLPGAEQVWAKPNVRWVLVGEMHGSNETPAAFLDLVCDALSRGRRVTVALELSTGDQVALDGIVTGKDLTAAKQALLERPVWKRFLDGRGSEAMLRLLLGLRELRERYPELSDAAFDAPYDGEAPGDRDKSLGKALLELGVAKPKDTVLALTGNYHAMLAPMSGYDLAAMFLPPSERLSLEVTDRGGEAWISTFPGQACGPSKGGVADKDPLRPRGVYLDRSLAPFGKVDGILSLGLPLSASEPAAGEPSPLPDCRIKYLNKKP